MVRKLLWACLGLALAAALGAGLWAIKLGQFQAMAQAEANQQFPPTVVNVAEVRQERWQPKVEAVGSVSAVQGALLRTEAEGQVERIAFEAGAWVQAGDELLRLDRDVELAQLQEAQAAAELARLSLKRARELRQSSSVSQGDLDAALANVRQTRAQVALIQALIDKKTLRAPFAGRLGIRRISVGQFLDKGSPVVSLQALDPVYVDFSLPQQRLSELARGLAVEVSSDAYPEQLFSGVISAFNPDVDAATRTVRVQATLANPDGRLRPGMFVSVAMVLERSSQVLLIPATAVQHGPYGDVVFLVEEGEQGLVLRQQLVRLGARRGDFVVVVEGLSQGQQLVSTGVFKLRGGMPVVIDNSLAPDFQLQPSPGNS
ncbi:efflux RND transporter periplasmic adaptor subunit [Gallaecimonas sp. GXIMD4217]|uniref:efflux RND transporter periplasmic adaptor subunit n=1 Tax=Gallaecimonas sp. GXIMD4217 TaxID=3131927 RepID=UPI00311B18CC